MQKHIGESRGKRQAKSREPSGVVKRRPRHSEPNAGCEITVFTKSGAHGANPRDIKLTVYEAHQRLSKRYSLAKDGKTVIKESFTTLSSGGYRVAAVPSGDIPAALQVFGTAVRRADV